MAQLQLQSVTEFSGKTSLFFKRFFHDAAARPYICSFTGTLKDTFYKKRQNCKLFSLAAYLCWQTFYLQQKKPSKLQASIDKKRDRSQSSSMRDAAGKWSSKCSKMTSCQNEQELQSFETSNVVGSTERPCSIGENLPFFAFGLFPT